MDISPSVQNPHAPPPKTEHQNGPQGMFFDELKAGHVRNTLAMYLSSALMTMNAGLLYAGCKVTRCRRAFGAKLSFLDSLTMQNPLWRK